MVESPGCKQRWRSLAAALFLALVLTLSIIALGYAARLSDWGATEFQLQNLDPAPAHFEAHFFDRAGSPALVITGTLGPEGTVYFKPEEDFGLDPAFEGTLSIESDSRIAGAVMHFMTTTIPGFNGNDVFQMTPDTITATHYYIPRVEKGFPPDGFSTRILISNLGAENALVDMLIRDSNGVPLVTTNVPVTVQGSQAVDLAATAGLPYGFTGWAEVTSGQPVRVEVLQANETQWAAYTAPITDAAELIAPIIRRSEQAVFTPTIDLLNVRDQEIDISICAANPTTCINLSLKASQSMRLTPEVPKDEPYRILSSGPVFAVIGLESKSGSWSYAAAAPGQASMHLAAPMLYDQYQGWSTVLWIYNTADITTTASIRYGEAGTGGTLPLAAEIGPHQSAGFGPAMGAEHYAAWVEAGAPVLGIVEGAHPDRKDNSFIYWADAYTPQNRLFLPLVVRNLSPGPSG